VHCRGGGGGGGGGHWAVECIGTNILKGVGSGNPPHGETETVMANDSPKLPINAADAAVPKSAPAPFQRQFATRTLNTGSDYCPMQPSNRVQPWVAQCIPRFATALHGIQLEHTSTAKPFIYKGSGDRRQPPPVGRHRCLIRDAPHRKMKKIAAELLPSRPQAGSLTATPCPAVLNGQHSGSLDHTTHTPFPFAHALFISHRMHSGHAPPTVGPSCSVIGHCGENAVGSRHETRPKPKMVRVHDAECRASTSTSAGAGGQI